MWCNVIWWHSEHEAYPPFLYDNSFLSLHASSYKTSYKYFPPNSALTTSEIKPNLSGESGVGVKTEKEKKKEKKGKCELTWKGSQTNGEDRKRPRESEWTSKSRLSSTSPEQKRGGHVDGQAET